MTEKNRLNWIDSCKGFAIILVVLGHMEKGLVSSGQFPVYNSFLSGLDRFIYTFHMPLFFIISGYIFYRAYCANKEAKKVKYKNQIINSIYVYFIFSTVQWLIQFAVSSEVNTELHISDLYLMPIKPMSPYWYTFVLVIYYVAFYYLDKLKINENVKLGAVAVISVAGSFFTFDVIFPVRLVLMHALFFYLGVYISKTGCTFFTKASVLVALGAVSAITLVLASIDILFTYVILPCIVALFVFGMFNKVGVIGESKFFRWIGKYSLEIYLTHCILTAGVRVVFSKIGLNICIVTLICGTVIAVIVPILCSMLLRKIGLYDLAFRPTEFFKRKK